MRALPRMLSVSSLTRGYATVEKTRFACAYSGFGSSEPPAHGTGARAMASERPQKRLRQAIVSPTEACTFLLSREPTASTAFRRRPAMKSSLTARRVQPWSIARGRKPDPGKNVFDFSTSSYTKTFSQGTRTWSRTRMASFSSRPLDGRLDVGAVQIEDARLRGAVPAARVLLIRRVVLGVGTERREEGRLVIGRPAHPAVGQARPGGDRVARGDQIGGAHGSTEISVRVAPRAGIGAEIGRAHV